MTELPPAPPALAAAALELLPARLHARVEPLLAARSQWTLTAEATPAGDSTAVLLPGDVTVTLAVSNGRVTDAVCGCLLAPRCAHRAAVLSACPVAESAPSQPAGAETAPTTEPVSITAQHRSSAHAVWTATAHVLAAGVTGCGPTERAALLRSVHGARIAGLHRAAATGTVVAEQLRHYAERSVEFDLTTVTSAIAATLLTCHRLERGVDVLGVARQRYESSGGLTLSGVLSEPVLTDTGYSGVVTWLLDARGRLYSLGDVRPGRMERCRPDLAADFADTAFDHRDLARRGLLVSGATVSSTGRLGRGSAVRPVLGAEPDTDGWTAPALLTRFAEPSRSQVARALAEDRGDGLLFLDVTVAGLAGDSVGVRAADGLDLALVPAHEGDGFAFRDGLRQLARSPGLQLRVVARIRPDRPGAVAALAISVRGSDDVFGPVRTLAWERLARIELTSGRHTDEPPPPPARSDAHGSGPLGWLERRLERTVRGGSALAGAGSVTHEVAALRAASMPNLAAILVELAAGSAAPDRDPFGRRIGSDTNVLTRAWLRASVAVDAARLSLRQDSWLGSA